MSVLSHLQNVASALNIAEREANQIARSVSALSIKLRGHFGSSIQQEMPFGSATRHTMLPRDADKQSDVDYMIVFDNSDGHKPQTFMNHLKRFAEKHYRSSQIRQSSPTVVLSLNHISFDLVPAYRPSSIFWNGGLHIPAPVSAFEEWMETEPLDLNQPLTNKNSRNKYKIKPVIRLLKYWNARNGYVYESYFLERHIMGSHFWFASNLMDYLYSSVKGLPTRDLPAYKCAKVEALQENIERVKKYDSDGMPRTAQEMMEEIFPSLN